jgi:hypothetical protein
MGVAARTSTRTGAGPASSERGPNALFRNQGDGTFADATASAGVGIPPGHQRWLLRLHDRDRDLDLFVVNYVRWSAADGSPAYSKPHPEDYCSPNSYDAPAPSTLYRNEGQGRFRDVSADAGLRKAFGNGLGLVCSDFDGDGWCDVFVADDQTLNLLWRNKADGTFEEVGVPAGCAVDQDGRKKAGMGTDAADVDGDGDEDLLVVNLAGESDSFYRNDQGRFSDRTPLVGLANASRPFTHFGWASSTDDDGGSTCTRPAARDARGGFQAASFDEPNVLLHGVPGGRFGAPAARQRASR